MNVMFDSIPQVRANFLRCSFPYYIIADSKGNKLWANDDENNLDAAADMLEADLGLIRAGNTGTYIIKHYKAVPKGGLKSNSEPDCISTYKRPQFDEFQKQEYRSNYQSNILEAIQGISMRLDTIERDRILSVSESDEDIEEESEPQGVLGQILKNERAMGVIENFLSVLAANITTSFFNSKKDKNTAIAGIGNMEQTQNPASAGPDQKQVTLESILETLFSKGVTINDLYILSNKSESELSFLLTLLRK